MQAGFTNQLESFSKHISCLPKRLHEFWNDENSIAMGRLELWQDSQFYWNHSNFRRASSCWMDACKRSSCPTWADRESNLRSSRIMSDDDDDVAATDDDAAHGVFPTLAA